MNVVDTISRLLGIAGPPIAGELSRCDLTEQLDPHLEPLRVLASHRNGFYLFESAVLFRPLCGSDEATRISGFAQWNEPNLWKQSYPKRVGGLSCFAEDIFGNQFCLQRGTSEVVALDAETAEQTVVGTSFAEFLDHLLREWRFLSGYELAHAWQLKHGALAEGTRLCPRVPFVGGGQYSVENLAEVPDVTAMIWRGGVARRVAGIPDGGEVPFDDLRPPWA